MTAAGAPLPLAILLRDITGSAATLLIPNRRVLVENRGAAPGETGLAPTLNTPTADSDLVWQSCEGAPLGPDYAGDVIAGLEEANIYVARRTTWPRSTATQLTRKRPRLKPPSGPSALTFLSGSLSICAAGSTRQGGPTGKRSRMHRRACSSRRCRRSRATGRGSTTGARCETKLNALPQFMTEIDGLDIHFIHVRSKHENALPLIITHGWPGSIIEQLKIIDPLTNPTAHGGERGGRVRRRDPVAAGLRVLRQADRAGWDPARIARAWTVLMKRLGYTKFVAQGGDWGNAVSEKMALQAPPGLLGIHTNMPATVPPDIRKALAYDSRRQPVSPPRSSTRGISSTSSTRKGWATPTRWRCARRRSTGLRIRPWAWPPGCSTTTRVVTS